MGSAILVTVNEQDSSGNLTQAASYTHDILGNLTQVNQGNQLRSYKYDAIGRLLYEKIPEQSAVINDGTGTYWTCKYTYTDYNAIATRTDARGVLTSYAYDSLHRLTQSSYSSVSGVITAPTVNYIYDSDSTYGTMANGKLLRINVGSDYQERYTFDSYIRVASAIYTIGTRTYTTSYQYNQASQRLQVGHMTYQFDSVGRLSAVGGLPAGGLSNITYNIASQMTGDRLTISGFNYGAPVTSITDETFGYDAARKQLTSQIATTTNTQGQCTPSCPQPPPAGGTNLSLTYNYSAAAGQMGVGSTAGNAEQLISVSGSIGGTSESASYTYDNYGHLVTSNQTSNGSSVQRRFEYDRWGNRTRVWDAISGGTQIQSISLQQSGGVPTNQISSVTMAGTVNYSYDAAGNLTNDGVHTYTYDSENRLVSMDTGAATYSYDQANRRYKKTVGATVTHYVWEGNQVLSEYNGGTGVVQAKYCYSGTRLFMKADTATQVYLSDRLSMRLTLSGIGAVTGRQAHLPFGEDFGESGTQEKHHFTSYERDAETASDYAVNRQYAPLLGRFLLVDAISCNERNPQMLNMYSYVHDDPINRIDITGRKEQEISVGDVIELVFDENYSDDEDDHQGSVGRPRPTSRQKHKPAPPRIKPPKLPDIDVLISVDSRTYDTVWVQVYGYMILPREGAKYRSLEMLLPGLTKISHYETLVGQGTRDIPQFWEHCAYCSGCTPTIVCLEATERRNVVDFGWLVYKAPRGF